MKTISALAAAAILGCATAAASTTGDPPAAPSATPIRHPTPKSCNRDATARKLNGKQRADFVRSCLAAKPSG